MRPMPFLLTAALCLAPAVLGHAAPPAAHKAKPAANAAVVQAAKSWLALMDANKYAESWQAASTSFQGAVTADKWAATAQQVRAQVGTLQTRSIASITPKVVASGPAAGQYEMVQYASKFSTAGAVHETVALVKQGSVWKAAGYFIK